MKRRLALAGVAGLGFAVFAFGCSGSTDLGIEDADGSGGAGGGKASAATGAATGEQIATTGQGSGAGGNGGGDVGSGSGGGGGEVGAGGAQAGSVAASAASVSASASSGSGGGCISQPDEDKDKDGYSLAQGDCNDCDPNINPGAIEVIVSEPVGDAGLPAPADEDCNGVIDDAPGPCDDAIALADLDPLNGAKAIDLCKQAAGPGDWGVVSAAYVRADGTPFPGSAQIGILDAFGPNVKPQLGARVLGLSSGRARTPDHPDACGSLTCGGTGAGIAPPGFPQDVPNCSGSLNINDDVGLEVKLRAPKNATGYSFLFTFYSFEYPEWVCTSFNDQFIALVSPAPAGSVNGNISFDKQKNPVSVNIAFFDVCAGCPLGTAELQGTGFDVWDDAGATSWLKTTAPVTGGEEISIRFAIWDTGDSAWDSTVLVDSFQWIANGGMVSVGTDHK